MESTEHQIPSNSVTFLSLNWTMFGIAGLLLIGSLITVLVYWPFSG